jgi:hypothetical protein
MIMSVTGVARSIATSLSTRHTEQLRVVALAA